MNYYKSKQILGLKCKKFTYQHEAKHSFVAVQQGTGAGPHDNSYFAATLACFCLVPLTVDLLVIVNIINR